MVQDLEILSFLAKKLLTSLLQHCAFRTLPLSLFPDKYMALWNGAFYKASFLLGPHQKTTILIGLVHKNEFQV